MRKLLIPLVALMAAAGAVVSAAPANAAPIQYPYPYDGSFANRSDCLATGTYLVDIGQSPSYSCSTAPTNGYYTLTLYSLYEQVNP